jgi:predicted transcriptional regulator
MENPKIKELQEQIVELQDQLKEVVEAYHILEEYVCEFVGSVGEDIEDNETLKYTNSIVQLAISRL